MQNLAESGKFTEVRFRVKILSSLATGQKVCLVGSGPELGDWEHTAAIELSPNSENPLVWQCTANLRRDVEVHYKYYIKEGAVILKWETWKENRKVLPLGVQLFVDDGIFGVEKIDGETVNVWEEYGWLTSDIQLRITLGAKNPHSANEPRLSSARLFDNTSEIRKIVFTSKDPKIRAKEILLPSPQAKHGEWDELKEYTFHTPDFKALQLYVDFYLSHDSTERIGRAIIYPPQLENLIGTITLPITNSGMEAVGDFTFEYIVVRPFRHPNLRHVLARTYWKSTQTVDLGHRGCGANRAVSKSGKKTHISENTILSFVTAGQLGREAIEFDVQLTQDGVPVIYHDFLVPIDPKKKFLVPVYQLRLEQFRELGKRATTNNREEAKHPKMAKIRENTDNGDGYFSPEERKSIKRRKSVGGIKIRPGENLHVQLQDTYATLEEVFDMVPLSTGFDIEIKYPNIEQQKKLKVPLYPERNQIVDAVLKVVFDFAKRDRSIYFSSFDPEICTMLSLKQPRYPVFFLTTGGTKLELDPRRNSIRQAIRFAKSVSLLGLVSDARPLLQSPELIKEVKGSGLLLATYGDENNELENVRLQEEMGVDAIISDHLIMPRQLKAKETKALLETKPGTKIHS